MKNKQSEAHESTQVDASADAYTIKVSDRLDIRWREWFDGLTITQTEDGNTILSGPVQDQAALHGILNRIRDLGLKLISVSLSKNLPTGEDS